MSKRARSPVDPELDYAIAASLADASAASSAGTPDEDLDRAIACSLEEAEPTVANPGTWDCQRCTFANDVADGRCAACEADRHAPFTSTTARHSGGLLKCGLPGCNAARRDAPPDNDFCCSEHARRAEARNLLAPQRDDVERVFLGRTGDSTCSLLTNRSPELDEVKRHFAQAWRKPGRVPRVERVYALALNPTIVERYERYKTAVGNERRRFHGTSAACGFGIDLKASPCALASCALCSILSSSFSLSHVGGGPNTAAFGHLRYGKGLYFSATSGKSNDYADGSERRRAGRRWRTMFAASVAAGKAYCTHEGRLEIERPPAGHDSVVGEVGPNLNYDELVVYRESAALPRFLIVYSME